MARSLVFEDVLERRVHVRAQVIHDSDDMPPHVPVQAPFVIAIDWKRNASMVERSVLVISQLTVSPTHVRRRPYPPIVQVEHPLSDFVGENVESNRMDNALEDDISKLVSNVALCKA